MLIAVHGGGDHHLVRPAAGGLFRNRVAHRLGRADDPQRRLMVDHALLLGSQFMGMRRLGREEFAAMECIDPNRRGQDRDPSRDGRSDLGGALLENQRH